MTRRMVLLALVAVLPVSCRGTYYNVMEAFGSHKRDILVDRVQEAREDQQEAKEQFASALDEFTKLVNFEGGDLGAAYKKASTQFERSEKKAEDVRKRIDAIETVGGDLFKEWEKELEQYSSDELRDRSRRQMHETRSRYDDMLRAMRRAEKAMDPVLAAFRDQTLFLKHNLNAQAVASLEGTVADLDREIRALIEEMNASIAEADRFIQAMGA